jgi:hypothetical protein
MFSMNTITDSELRQLIDYSSDPCVSLYMPIYTGAENRQNSARLKKLLRKAEDALLRRGTQKSLAQELLAPASDRLALIKFSEEIGQGLAVFSGHSGCQLYGVHVPCDELSVVGNHFYILPLVSSLAVNAAFYVLAVSQNQVRLLHGTRTEMEEVTVPELPVNLKEALRFDPREPNLQAHQAHTDLQKHKEGLVFHGHGGEPDAAEEEILAYCRAIERSLWPILRDKTEPMVFAGVDYIFPVYRDVNRYPHLMPTPIIGNPELLSAVDLRERAWSIVEPTLDEQRQAALSKYGDCIGQGRTSNSIDSILIAASAGAVETLFIDPTAKQTGAFDVERLTVQIDDEPQEMSEDLVNLAVTIVLRNSGMVMPLASEDIPAGGAMAATMRYVFPPVEQMSTASQTQRRRW